MRLDNSSVYDYKILLDNFGEFRGFKELIKLDEIIDRLDRFNFSNAKSIVLELDLSTKIDLSKIDVIVEHINKNICKSTELMITPHLDDSLKEDEMIFQVLIVENKIKQGV